MLHILWIRWVRGKKKKNRIRCTKHVMPMSSTLFYRDKIFLETQPTCAILMHISIRIWRKNKKCSSAVSCQTKKKPSSNWQRDFPGQFQVSLQKMRPFTLLLKTWSWLIRRHFPSCFSSQKWSHSRHETIDDDWWYQASQAGSTAVKLEYVVSANRQTYRNMCPCTVLCSPI